MNDTDFLELPISELLDYWGGARHVGIRRYFYSGEQPASVHRHRFYSMELILRGRCGQNINGIRYDCGPGTLFLLSPLDHHRFLFNREPLDTWCLSFTENVLSQEVLTALQRAETPWVLSLSADALPRISGLLELAEKELSGELPLQQSAADAIINLLIVGLLRELPETRQELSGAKAGLHGCVGYVRKHFREPLTLEAVAKTFSVTPNHFCRVFRQLTGITFKAYLLQLRLEYAMQQLAQTDQSVTEVCLESGFNSPSYFSKAFRERFGYAPSDLRRQKNDKFVTVNG